MTRCYFPLLWKVISHYLLQINCAWTIFFFREMAFNNVQKKLVSAKCYETNYFPGPAETMQSDKVQLG